MLKEEQIWLNMAKVTLAIAINHSKVTEFFKSDFKDETSNLDNLSELLCKTLRGIHKRCSGIFFKVPGTPTVF